MKLDLKFIVLVLLCLSNVLVTECFSNTFYVSETGIDVDNSEGTISNPFLTIQNAIGFLDGNDTLLIRGGTYIENIVVDITRTVDGPIVIKNCTDEEVIVDGGNLLSTVILYISNQSDLTIEGLIIENKYIQDAKGIYVVNEGSNIHIRSCTIRNIGWGNDPDADPAGVSPTGQAHGVLFNGRTSAGLVNVSITDSKIHNIISGNSEALTLVGNIDSFDITRDTLYENKNIAIVVAGHYVWAVDSGVDASLNQSRNGTISYCKVYNNQRFSNVDAPAGIYADGAKNVLIQGNESYNNGNGFSVGCENSGDTTKNVVMVNNISYNNVNQGVIFGANSGMIFQCTLKNNTFYENGSFGNFRSEISLQKSTDCVIVQNICIPKSISHYAASIFGYTLSNLIVDKNIAYRLDGTTPSESELIIEGNPSQFTATNTSIVDPLFINATVSNPNFTLSSSSPGIDEGLKTYGLYHEKDFYMNDRAVNGKLDYGAIESVDGDCPATLIIDNSYILEGRFIASTLIQIDLSNEVLGTMSNEMILNAPNIEFINGESQILFPMSVNNIGCIE